MSIITVVNETRYRREFSEREIRSIIIDGMIAALAKDVGVDIDARSVKCKFHLAPSALDLAGTPAGSAEIIVTSTGDPARPTEPA